MKPDDDIPFEEDDFDDEANQRAEDWYEDLHRQTDQEPNPWLTW